MKSLFIATIDTTMKRTIEGAEGETEAYATSRFEKGLHRAVADAIVHFAENIRDDPEFDEQVLCSPTSAIPYDLSQLDEPMIDDFADLKIVYHHHKHELDFETLKQVLDRALHDPVYSADMVKSIETMIKVFDELAKREQDTEGDDAK